MTPKVGLGTLFWKIEPVLSAENTVNRTFPNCIGTGFPAKLFIRVGGSFGTVLILVLE